MVVNGAQKDVTKYSKKLPYKVLRADNDAHVVNDYSTGITAYICYKAYDAAPAASAFVALAKEKEAKAYVDIASITAETIVMERALSSTQAVMSICTPDLGIQEVAYTTPEPSAPLQRSVTLNGTYRLASENPAVSLTTQAGQTTITATCQHGQPVEFIIEK